MASGPLKKLTAYEKAIENQSFNYLSQPGALRRVFAASALARAQLGRNHIARSYQPTKDSLLNRRMIHAAGSSPYDLSVFMARRIQCLRAWEKARAANDFSRVAEPLQALVNHIRKDAALRAAALGKGSPYEALVDGYTPGLRLRDLDMWSDDLSVFCGRVLGIVKSNPQSDPALALSVADQKNMARVLMMKMGLNPERLADTAHPLTLGTQDDVRIGMHYDPANFAQTMLDLMHETGHAVYRAAISPAHHLSAAMDEAMALMVENHAARTPIFAFNLVAMAQDMEIPSLDKKINAAHVFSDFFNDRRGKTRAHAHELAYPLHLILRIRLERMVIDDNLPVRDIPKMWKQIFCDLTDMAPPQDDCDGALQDIHWFAGQWGYFPQYLAGMLAAAQFYETALEKNPAIGAAIQRGQIRPLTGWIENKIAARGEGETFLDQVENVTRTPLDTWSWMNHAMGRYGSADWWQYRPDLPKIGLTD